ncbi:cytosine permease [Paenalkalicoccus suaedae]|uniref:Cytosine permease n=1 Tax=Paenalkalicoccus suaedae TaxID=2592382 RepID=A0A859FE44_9BACI|nr:cytosine permease [Paenalkalicoccus suaedae]QKS71151.1 cytosine permease [Paenalkalicoccus suaedae]
MRAIAPKLERIGLEPVPTSSKTTTASEYIVMQTAIAVNAGNMLVPALAVMQGGLSFQMAVLSTVIGAVTAFFFVSLLAIPGAKYGLPAQYLMRSIFGIKGAMYLSSPIRTLTSLYWFAVQTIGGAYVIRELLARFGIELPLPLLTASLGIVMVTVALVGFQAMKRFTKLSMPILLMSIASMLWILSSQEATGISHSSETSVSVMLFYASLAFVQYVSGVSSSADLARYAKSPKHAFTGIYIGNSLGFLLTAILGAYTATLTNDWNPFVQVSALSGTAVSILIFTAAVCSMLIINVNNAYTGGYSLLNSLPQLKRITSVLIFGGVAVLLSSFPRIVEQAESFISLLGAFIIPLAAVVVTDFLVIKKGKIEVEHLKDSQRSMNKIALITVVGGFFVYLLLPASIAPGFIVFILCGIAYYILQTKR